MVHVSNIQTGARANSAADLLSRGKPVKVKVMSVAGNRVGLSMKDVDQVTGRDLTPHLRIKSEAEMEEERIRTARVGTGTNAVPLRSKDDGPIRSAKRLTSPERWEIKQLISSGAIDASEYPDLDEDFNNPMAHAEIEEELDVEIREDEPPFLAGQTKRTLDLSPVKIVKAPDGSLNRAALAGASLAKERRELRQQEANEEADSQARDFSQPWLDPMSKETDKVFAQDMRGNLRSQKAGEVPSWKQSSFNKATTFGEITNLSIQDQRKSLPIYKLRDPLLKAIDEVGIYCHILQITFDIFCSIKSLSSLVTLVLARQLRWSSTSLNLDMLTEVALAVLNPVVSLRCPWLNVYQRRWVVGWDRKLDIQSVSRTALARKHGSNT